MKGVLEAAENPANALANTRAKAVAAIAGACLAQGAARGVGAGILVVDIGGKLFPECFHELAECVCIFRLAFLFGDLPDCIAAIRAVDRESGPLREIELLVSCWQIEWFAACCTVELFC